MSNSKVEKFDSTTFLKTVPLKPGVYQMLDAHDKLLYVGKAKQLRNRLSSYFRDNLVNSRIWSMVKQIADVQIILTDTEAEALLLESNLIKKHHPRYNVLLRDDKSYPYIMISKHDFPRVSFYRGSRQSKHHFYGPYPSSGAVRETLNLLQKLFRVRQCEDSYFANRSRPCLQFQIKRCSAPCTNEIDSVQYNQHVQQTIKFLEGNSKAVISELVDNMDAHVAALEYEKAAECRDLIEQLRQISQQQIISGGKGDIDIIAIQFASQTASIQVHTIRNGHHLGNKNFFPKIPKTIESESSILSSFIAQYYLQREPPKEIIVSHRLEDQALIDFLSIQSRYKVKLTTVQRGDKYKWLQMALRNAYHALQTEIDSKKGMEKRLLELQKILGLEARPITIECYDISHTQGEATVGSCVVFRNGLPAKSDYRRYNITGITGGDDYAAMHQVLLRRFEKIVVSDGKLPDVLLIDGGKGQVAQAYDVLTSLNITSLCVVGIVKGDGRKAENDQLIVDGRKVLLDAHSSVMHLLQAVRDEAHRFAITGHRQRRQKARTQSGLEQIQGVGAKRRQALLKQFGGMRALARASVDELAKVPGISVQLARKVYEQLNG
ncbi:MAG TPA: excinuclease ABC subunit UvrC [Thiotrichaceae bacterium]|nr:excinuclease ABC subunit UvrC [Thiotrichaceae bacterium]